MPALQGFDLLVLSEALTRDFHDLSLEFLLESEQFLLSLGKLCQFASELTLQKSETGLDLLELLLFLEVTLPLLLAYIGPELDFLLFES